MSEHDEQVALFQWAAINQHNIPELEALYAVPNGGHRHLLVAQKMKAEGVKRGVWDIALDVPAGDYHGFRGEMKFGKNQLTDYQIMWQEIYERNGYYCKVAYNWSEMAQAIVDYLGYKVKVGN